MRGNFQKRQHCYITAIQLPWEYAKQAVKLTQYGLENFEDDWFSTYTSYLYIGHIYEGISNHQKAFEAYLRAKEALGLDHPQYVEELSKDLMWMKLHVDSFRYSVELEEYFCCYKKTDDFSKSIVGNALRLAVANIVISLHHGKLEAARRSLETARTICKPNYTGKLHAILARHKYRESLDTTPEATAFVKSLKI